jgi:hypothetical protein
MPNTTLLRNVLNLVTWAGLPGTKTQAHKHDLKPKRKK